MSTPLSGQGFPFERAQLLFAADTAYIPDPKANDCSDKQSDVSWNAVQQRQDMVAIPTHTVPYDISITAARRRCSAQKA